MVMGKPLIAGPLRIAFFFPTPGGMTGAPRRLLTLMKGLMDHGGFDIALVGDPMTRLSKEAECLGCKVLSVQTGPILSQKHGILLSGSFSFRVRILWELLLYNITLLQSLRTFRPDVVWIRGSKGIAFGILAVWLLRRPLVWDIDYEPPSQGIVGRLHDIGLRMSSKVVLQYVAAGEQIFGADKAMRYKQKLHALLPGIELKRLHSYHDYRLQQVNQVNEEPLGRPFCFLQVGTICDRKNQRFTLQVLHELKRCKPDLEFELWLAGDVYEEDYAEALKRDVDKLGLHKNIKFLGWREDIPQLIAEADLLLLPSKNEGIPNVVQEAIYIGCPVLASNAGGIPEAIGNCAIGWALPINDPSLWASKILWFILHREKCKKAVLKTTIWAEKQFSTDIWVSRYAKLFYSLTGRKNKVRMRS